jgi:hypothetical protein
VARRPALYGRLTDPDPPVRAAVDVPLVPGRATGRIAVDVLDRKLAAADLAFLADAGTALLVSPRAMDGVLDDGLVLAATGPDRAELRRGGQVLASWERSHGPGAPGGSLGPVVPTPLGGLGVLLGADGLLPEACRVLLLDGADLVVWLAGEGDLDGLAAARAAENRVNLVLAGPGSGRILDPAGGVLAAAGERPRLIAAVVSLADARQKQMAPGTDVVRGRQPETYRDLT